MTDISDNVQSAITAALQSASIHLDYVGDLHQGYYHDANQETKTSGTIDNQVTNNTLNKTKHQHQHQHQNDTPALASTATGIPDPTAVTTAIDRVEGDEKKEQGADDEPGVASTATGLPASEPVINAMKAGDDSIQDDSTKESTPRKTTNTVTSTPSTAFQNVIDNIAPSDSQDGPSPNPSAMKHQQQQTQNQQNQQQQQQQQQQPEKSCNQTEPSQSSGNVNLPGDADQGDQNDNVSGAKTGAIDIDSNPATMQEPTHTIVDDNVKSVDRTPVEPMVENVVTNIQNVEEPVVEEKLIREPPPTATTATGQTTTTNSSCTTPADVKVEDLPNVETRAFVSKPFTEHTDSAGQVVVTEDPTADETKVEQVFTSPAAAAATTATASSPSMDNTNTKQMEVTDINAEDMPVAEEPATTEDIKAVKSINKKGDYGQDIATDAPIKKDDGTVNINDLNVEQGSVERQLVGAKEDNTILASSSTNDRTEPHASSASNNTEAEFNKSKQQQQYEQTSTPSRSIESKSLSPQSSTQQQGQATTTTSTDQTQEQPTSPEPNASKSSKCIIM